jgi:hypothetical protein
MNGWLATRSTTGFPADDFRRKAQLVFCPVHFMTGLADSIY